MPPTGTKPPPLPGWMSVGYNYVVGDSKGTNIEWFAYDETEAEAATSADLNQISVLQANSWLVRFSPHLANVTVLETMRIVLFRSSGEIAATFAPAYNGAGGDGSNPGNIAAVVNWVIDAYYRGGKPKMFLPGIPPSAIATETQLEPDYVSALTLAMGLWNAEDVPTFVSDHLTSAPSHIAPSWATGGAYRLTAVQRAVSEAWVQPRVCTQRRRLGKPTG